MATSRRVEQINQVMLRKFEELEIEDTPTARYLFLLGMKKGVELHKENSIARTQLLIAFTAEIANQRFKMLHPEK